MSKCYCLSLSARCVCVCGREQHRPKIPLNNETGSHSLLARGGEERERAVAVALFLSLDRTQQVSCLTQQLALISRSSPSSSSSHRERERETQSGQRRESERQARTLIESDEQSLWAFVVGRVKRQFLSIATFVNRIRLRPN